jgi:hypothetical protein
VSGSIHARPKALILLATFAYSRAPPHEMRVLKRHGVRQGESVLGADYNVLSA